MQVIKRDGKVVDFDQSKIKIAIEKANKEVKPRERATKEEINQIISYIEELDKKRILVEDIQDIIEEQLMTFGKYILAKKYITYRYTRELVRKSNTTDQSIKELIDGESDYWNNENSNKNARVVTTQRDYLAGITSTDITRRFLLPEDVVKAHDEGIIHFHDADYFAQNALTNCELINLEDMLQNGTIMNGVMIEKPHRFLTAMTIATQIILGVTSSTYGGATVSITHLAPFVRSSYDRYYKKYKQRGLSEKQCKEYAEQDTKKEIYGISDLDSLHKDKIKAHDVAEELKDKIHTAYEEKEKEIGEQQLRELERVVMLKIVDDRWMDHIDAMDELKDGIGLQAYGQKDPVVQYRIEGFDMFEQMNLDIQTDVVKFLMNARKREGNVQRTSSIKITGEGLDNTVSNELGGKAPRTSGSNEPIVNNEPKVGRNDPCPCGSGKKYKNCCGK